MSWQEQSGFVSQLDHAPDGQVISGSGWLDCFEACLLKYLREQGRYPLDGSIPAQLSAVAEIVRGYGDSPSNDATTAAQAEAALRHFGIDFRYTESYNETALAPWGILLVNGPTLRPPSEPADWYGTPVPTWPDHFIVWLPNKDGHANYFANPLAADRAQHYLDLGSVRSAFAFAYLLPSTGHGEDGPVLRNTIKRCALKAAPNHVCVGILAIPATVRVTLLEGRARDPHTLEIWCQIRWQDHTGWVLMHNLR